MYTPQLIYPIHLLMDIWPVFRFWQLQIKQTSIDVLECTYVFLRLVKYLGKQWLQHTAKLFSKVVISFYTPASGV